MKSGHLNIETTFIVPDEKEWPEDLRGMALGYIAARIRNARSYAPKHEALRSIGFNFGKLRRRYGWDIIRQCLVIYKEINGHLRVPVKFIVPEHDSDTRWPAHLGGVSLGAAVSQIRERNDYGKHRAELEELGFDYNHQCLPEFGFHRIKEVLALYLELHGDLLVPFTYIVPEDPYWPKDMWNMKLGVVVSHIRNRNNYAEHKNELIDMGFDYRKQKRGRRKSVP
jgi:hypothetical protein